MTHFRLVLYFTYIYNTVYTLSFSVGLHDLEYQNSTTLISASWNDFLDLESYIDHYIWCVGIDQDDTEETSLVACTSVGLSLKAFTHIETPLNNGIVMYAFINVLI